MCAVYTFGETVYDIIFAGMQPVAAKAGGAMLNTAVSLGRCGHKVSLLTEIGQDRVGRFILSFVQENGVDTDFIFPYLDFPTPVALAFLDENNSASYSFYKKYPQKRLQQNFPEPVANDILLFGSFYSLSADIRDTLVGFIRKAKESGTIIIYDPNIRKNHIDELKTVFPWVMENIAMADIVRGSDEDFGNLFNSFDPEKVLGQISELGCKRLIISRRDGAEMFLENTRVQARAKKIKVVSTIGAGDSFNAGIIHGLVRAIENRGILEDLNVNEWKSILETGIRFAADTCKSYDNYVSKEFGEVQR